LAFGKTISKNSMPTLQYSSLCYSRGIFFAFLFPKQRLPEDQLQNTPHIYVTEAYTSVAEGVLCVAEAIHSVTERVP